MRTNLSYQLNRLWVCLSPNPLKPLEFLSLGFKQCQQGLEKEPLPSQTHKKIPLISYHTKFDKPTASVAASECYAIKKGMLVHSYCWAGRADVSYKLSIIEHYISATYVNLQRIHRLSLSRDHPMFNDIYTPIMLRNPSVFSKSGC